MSEMLPEVCMATGMGEQECRLERFTTAVGWEGSRDKGSRKKPQQTIFLSETTRVPAAAWVRTQWRFQTEPLGGAGKLPISKMSVTRTAEPSDRGCIPSSQKPCESRMWRPDMSK